MKILQTITLLYFATTATDCIAHQNLICPESIDVKQKLASELNGAEVIGNEQSKKQSLLGVSFFDSHPKHRAELIPEDVEGNNRSVWFFSKDESEPYILCSYVETHIEVAIKLPKGTERCEVSVNKHVLIGRTGARKIEAVLCR